MSRRRHCLRPACGEAEEIIMKWAQDNGEEMKPGGLAVHGDLVQGDVVWLRSCHLKKVDNHTENVSHLTGSVCLRRVTRCAGPLPKERPALEDHRPWRGLATFSARSIKFELIYISIYFCLFLIGIKSCPLRNA